MCRNYLTSSLRRAKREYFRFKFNSCLYDAKSTWKSINGLIRPNQQRTQNCEISGENGTISDPVQVATKFNEHYSSLPTKLAREIPAVNSDPLDFVDRCPNSFVFFPTDVNEVTNVIQSFKSKGSHTETIPSFMFKHAADIIAPKISVLFNSSVMQGRYPDILKVARVIPIHKSGKKDVVINYRPISTLEFLDKIFERLMYGRLSSFFNKYGIICDEQFGFTKDRSTNDAILRYVQFIRGALGKKLHVLSVMLDFSKAFDTVHHHVLIDKLYKVGIRGNTNNWIRSYLSDRSQYVHVNGVNSPLLPVSSGVPQGSILGPLLFLVYINDMSRCCSKLNFVHFADDTTVFLAGPNLSDLYDDMNSELKLIDLWLCANRLSLNIDKTVYLIHSDCNKASDKQIIIRNVSVKQVKQTKFLGMILDDRLNYRDHILHVCGKLSKSCGILWRLRDFVPAHVLKRIYMCLVFPYLVYCVEVWGRGCRTSYNRLCALQNKCVRLLGGPNVSIVQLYKMNNLLSMNEIHEYFMIVKFYQYYVKQRSRFFKSLILSYQVSHNISTRFKSKECLNFPLVHKSKCLSSFVYTCLKLWNDLPLSIRTVKCLFSFKRTLRNHLMTIGNQ